MSARVHRVLAAALAVFASGCFSESKLLQEYCAQNHGDLSKMQGPCENNEDCCVGPGYTFICGSDKVCHSDAAGGQQQVELGACASFAEQCKGYGTSCYYTRLNTKQSLFPGTSHQGELWVINHGGAGVDYCFTHDVTGNSTVKLYRGISRQSPAEGDFFQQLANNTLHDQQLNHPMDTSGLLSHELYAQVEDGSGQAPLRGQLIAFGETLYVAKLEFDANAVQLVQVGGAGDRISWMHNIVRGTDTLEIGEDPDQVDVSAQRQTNPVSIPASVISALANGNLQLKRKSNGSVKDSGVFDRQW